MMYWRICLGTLVAGILLANAAAAQLSGPEPSSASVPSLQNLRGQPATLDIYTGRIVLLNFWATSCGLCRKEMPELNRLFGRIDKRKVAIVGIAADDRAAAQAFVSRLGIRYPIAIGKADQVFAWSESLGNRSEGLPFSVLVDRDGAVRWIKSGGQGVSAAEVMAEIDRLQASGR